MRRCLFLLFVYWSASFPAVEFAGGEEPQGWGSVWQNRMTIGQAALDDALKMAQAGKIQEALTTVDQVIASNPRNWRAYFLKSAILILAHRNDEALAQMDLSISLARKANVSSDLLSELYQSRGRSCLEFGRPVEAKRSMEAALHLQPSDAKVLNDLAWMLATSDDKRVRDGRHAVALALKACHLDGWSNAFAIDTLAAAYAEAGQFPNAVKYQQLAMRLLTAKDRAEQMSGMQHRLELYQSNQAYRSAV